MRYRKSCHTKSGYDSCNVNTEFMTGSVDQRTQLIQRQLEYKHQRTKVMTASALILLALFLATQQR